MTSTSISATGGPLSGLLSDILTQAPSNSAIMPHATMAHLTFGLKDTDTAETGWIRVDSAAVTGGSGNADARFTFEAGGAAWRELIAGMPINRLVRQGKMVISGDARNCVQNWLLVFEIFNTVRKAR
ncbi:MAG: hypothetical protein M9932_06620 [Xanthobacteraceae bacterium]|nr:hypothetical protein [Xanthobacteraceae bacterium]